MIYLYGTDSSAPYNDFLLSKKDFENRKILINFDHPNERLKGIRPLEKRPIKENWKPMEIQFYSKSKSRKVPDLSRIHELRTPVFSYRARNVLEEILNENGEFLEMYCIDDEKTYYAYNVLTYVDILDDAKIQKDPERHLYYKKDVDFNNLGIFKILSNTSSVYMGIFIGQKFVDIVNKYKLKGDLFYPENYVRESVDSEKNKLLIEKFDLRLEYRNTVPINFPYWKWEAGDIPEKYKSFIKEPSKKIKSPD